MTRKLLKTMGSAQLVESNRYAPLHCPHLHRQMSRQINGGRSKITTNTDTCACMHILNQWELHNVHPQQKTALKTSMLSLKPKSILHNSVVGLACIHVPKLQHAILESVYIQKANVWIPMRGKRTKQERYLEGAEKQRGSPSKEVRTWPLCMFQCLPNLVCFARNQGAVIMLKWFDLSKTSRWSRCLQHDWSGPPTDCFQLEVRSNFN